MKRDEIVGSIVRQRVIAIVRASSADEAVVAARTLLSAGLRAVEVSLTTPEGLGAVETLSREAPPGAVIGAGTVLDAPVAADACRAGARFLVSPVTDADIVSAGHEHDAVVIPGAATATEILHCLRHGADLVKVFPAGPLGLDHFRALRGPLPDAPLVPTGGIAPDDADEWIAAGAVAVGIGSALTSGTETEISERVATLLARTTPDHA